MTSKQQASWGQIQSDPSGFTKVPKYANNNWDIVNYIPNKLGGAYNNYVYDSKQMSTSAEVIFETKN